MKHYHTDNKSVLSGNDMVKPFFYHGKPVFSSDLLRFWFKRIFLHTVPNHSIELITLVNSGISVKYYYRFLRIILRTYQTLSLGLRRANALLVSVRGLSSFAPREVTFCPWNILITKIMSHLEHTP